MKQENQKIEKRQKVKDWFEKYILWVAALAVIIAGVALVWPIWTGASVGTDKTENPDHAVTTENMTEDGPETSTEALTQRPTEEFMEMSTEEPTQESTESSTEAPTQTSTEEATEVLTEAPTEKPTERPTEKPTEAPTQEPTEAETMYLPSQKSEVDYNGNGVDDYTDILLGARQDAINRPTYDGSWWPTGYPPENIGVCSDVIWRAFKQAGYSLKDMIDADILARKEAYPLNERPEPPIDFRRVRNLRIFFEEYAKKLTLDIYAINEWQPGDIVIFGNDRHIGIVSDVRDMNGIPYIIHNGGQENREENYLVQKDSQQVTGHYRWDASQIPEEVLRPWVE